MLRDGMDGWDGISPDRSISRSPSGDKNRNLWYFFCIFYDFLNFFFYFSEKITPFFTHFHSQIWLYDCVFWQFSTPPGHLRGCGKLPKVQTFAPSGLWKRLYKWFLETWFLTILPFHYITLFYCTQMHQKWIDTIPFGSGHTLDTLNHGLGSLFCCFITLFGAGGILDPPGTPWCPQAPLWTPWFPSWPLVCHPGP